MSRDQKPGAVIFAKDCARLSAFYEGVLAMAVTYADESVIVLQSSSQQLVIHALPSAIATSIAITSPPQRRTDTAIKVIFSVRSIAETRSKAFALGGELDPEEREFHARGVLACDGCDPEGNVIQFRQNVS